MDSWKAHNETLQQGSKTKIVFGFVSTQDIQHYLKADNVLTLQNQSTYTFLRLNIPVTKSLPLARKHEGVLRGVLKKKKKLSH